MLVEVAAEVEALTSVPGLPYGAECDDELPHAWRRGRPRHAEALFDVRLDLAAQAQDHASAREHLKVVSGVGDRHRRTCEGDRDASEQLYPFAVLSGQCQRKEGVVTGVDRDGAVVAESLKVAHARGHRSQVGDQVTVDLHWVPGYSVLS